MLPASFVAMQPVHSRVTLSRGSHLISVPRGCLEIHHQTCSETQQTTESGLHLLQGFEPLAGELEAKHTGLCPQSPPDVWTQ